MKKTFSRALSLLLVLVMVMGVMPVALAANHGCSVSLTTDKSVYEAGEKVYMTLSVTTGDGWTVTGVSGSMDKVGTTSFEVYQTTREYVVVTFSKEGEADLDLMADVDIDVNEAEVAAGLKLTIDKAVIYGGSDPAELSVIALPYGAALPSDVTFEYDATVVKVTGNTVKGQKVGTTAITAFSASTGLRSNAVTVEVKGPKASLTGASATMEMIVGEMESMGVSVTPTAAKTDATITYSSSDKTVATVDSTGVIVAKSKGQATITATMTLNLSSDFELGVATATTVVTVTDGGYIECDDVNSTDSYALLAPALYYNGYYVSGATFRCTPSNNLYVTTTDNKNFTVTLSGNSTSNSGYLTFYADDFYAPYSNVLVPSTQIASKRVNVSFFDSNTLTVTLVDNISTFSFNEKGIASYATIGNSNAYNVSTSTMEDLIGQAISVDSSVANKISNWDIDVDSSSGGNLTYGSQTRNLTVPYAQLDDVRFAQQSATNKRTSFVVSALNSSGGVLGQLYVVINAGSATSGIEYSTTSGKAVTFSASDFYKYWNTMTSATTSTSTTYGTLSYVTFGTPTSGTLYTNSGKTTKTTTGMMFYYNNSGVTSTNAYSLNGVTFMPTTSTAQYTVEIPFYAYGTGSKSITGSVVIKVNEKSNTIGARGITFEDLAYTIAQNYNMNSKQTMGYVTFELPSAQYATLYRSIPVVNNNGRVAEATRVSSSDRFYYYTNTNTSGTTISTTSPLFNANGSVNSSNNLTGSSAQYPLTDVALVPAAGYSGNLTLKYTAYTSSGSNPMSGEITFVVETQKDSKMFFDVNATSYDWAADSVDFLYYEGVAKGASSNKYNPKANITRGDFMVMLYRAFLEDDYKTTSVTDNFPDVPNTAASQELYRAVGIAKQLGIAQGSGGKYNPKANITREEAMVLIYRTMNKVNRTLRYSTSTNASTFSDYSKVSDWATSAITNLVSHGVIKGSSNKIDPKSNITRAEMACILHRVITY